MRTKRGTFAPGHARIYPSEKPIKTIKSWNARKIMEEYGFDPIIFLIRVATEGKIPGTIQKVPVEERIKAAKELAKYAHPTLSATHVTSVHEERTIERVNLDAIMEDPAMVEAAQKLSLAATAQHVAALHAERALPPAPEAEILDAEILDAETEEPPAE